MLDELCEVVEQEGHLCTSPLADVKLTNRYQSSWRAWEDFNAYVRLLDAVVPHFHVWMVRHRVEPVAAVLAAAVPAAAILAAAVPAAACRASWPWRTHR